MVTTTPTIVTTTKKTKAAKTPETTSTMGAPSAKQVQVVVSGHGGVAKCNAKTGYQICLKDHLGPH